MKKKMKIYCEASNGKRFATQGREEGNIVIVKVGGREVRLSSEELERGFTVIVGGWNFEKYSAIEHDSKLYSKQRW